MFDSGSCNTLDCNDMNPGVDNVTIRVSTYMQKLSKAADGCTELYARVSGTTCYTPVDPTDTLTFSYATDFRIYKEPDTGVMPSYYPGYYPTRFDTLTYPNIASNPAIAGIIDCRDQSPGQYVRFAWLKTTGGPCYYDPTYLVSGCTNWGKVMSNSLFYNIEGNVLPDGAIWAGTNCPF